MNSATSWTYKHVVGQEANGRVWGGWDEARDTHRDSSFERGAVTGMGISF